MKKYQIIMAGIMAIMLGGTAFGQQSVRNDQVFARESGNGGPWGDWSRAVYCPSGSWATGYAMRVEPKQGIDDDTALNAIALYCSDRNGRNMARIVPHEGFWGNWREGANCSQGAFITHFQLKVEPRQGIGDDTAANSVAFLCRGNQRIEASGGGPWGDWGEWQGDSQGVAICGVRAKVEPKQGPAPTQDDTALNDLEFTWCNI